MKMRAVIGIDTSCYTTSLAAVDENGRLISFHRRLLSVNGGEIGLRQSEGVFLHLKQLPILYDELVEDIRAYNVCAVCVSSKPTSLESSYMPVFTVGLNFARVISKTLGVTLFESNHQLGHFAAAKIGLNYDFKDFIGVHLSGGTSDFLKILSSGKIIQLASSRDLHVGQLIDRVGVALGFKFPAGPELEKLAMLGKSFSEYKSSVFKDYCSFSGLEAMAMRDIASEKKSREDIACELFDAVSRTVLKQLNYINQNDRLPVLITGGVASSALIRKMIFERNSKRFHFDIFFGERIYSGDNAAGVAMLGLERFNKEGNI